MGDTGFGRGCEGAPGCLSDLALGGSKRCFYRFSLALVRSTSMLLVTLGRPMRLGELKRKWMGPRGAGRRR